MIPRRVSPSAATVSARRAFFCIFLLSVLLAALFLISFVLGRYDVPLGQVGRILLSRVIPLEQTWTAGMQAVVLNIRLPRIVLAMLVGACLALAGAAYQSVFNNPMAAPDILGASSGACFGAALAILLGLGKGGTTALAFVMSMATVALVFLIGKRTRGARTVGILLAGVMVSSLFSSGTSYLKLVADPGDELPAITYWLMGSLASARGSDVRFALIPMALGALPLIMMRWQINLLTLSEEEAASMGVNTSLLRALVILCATLLTAASVAASGMIGWVGLVIPHLCRKLAGSDCRRLLPVCAVMGALFLLLVDNVSRNLAATEIPIGILTAFIGAPFFIFLMTRKEHVW